MGTIGLQFIRYRLLKFHWKWLKKIWFEIQTLNLSKWYGRWMSDSEWINVQLNISESLSFWKKIEKEDYNQCWLFNAQLLSCNRIRYCLLMSKPFFIILCNLFYSLSFFNLLKIMRQKSCSIVNSNSSNILNKMKRFSCHWFRL